MEKEYAYDVTLTVSKYTDHVGVQIVQVDHAFFFSAVLGNICCLYFFVGCNFISKKK